MDSINVDNNATFNAGLYTRISVKEKIKSIADSISNQKIILTQYAMNQALQWLEYMRMRAKAAAAIIALHLSKCLMILKKA